MTTIYTKTGDDGTTGLLFGGRVPKDDPLIDAYGTLDETVAALGMARAEGLDQEIHEAVFAIQRGLFVAAADLAANPRARDRLTPGISAVTAEMVDRVERSIDTIVAASPLRPVFVVPGATRASAALDLARAFVRRAERRLVSARGTGHDTGELVLVYLNRVGDLLYVLARAAAGDHPEPVSHD